MDTLKALADAKAALAAEKAKRLQATTTGVPKEKGMMPAKAKAMLAKFGCKSFDEVISINTAEKKFSYVPAEERQLVKTLKESVDTAVILAKMFGKSVKELKFYQTDLQFVLKAFGIDSGDDGFDWIPTMVSDAYLDEYNISPKVAGLFMDVKMLSNPFKWPVLSNGAIARMVGEVATIGAQAFKTDKTITFDAEKLMNSYELPEELNEDSAVDMVRAIRQELIEGQEKAFEIAILEGAVTPIHTTSQLPDVAPRTAIAAIANTPEKACNGIRKRLIAAGATAQVNAGGNQVTEAELFQARAKMGKFGVDPTALVLISSPKTYNQLLQLDDVRTIDSYGAQATVLTGELAKYEGAPVIVSEYLREDTNASGVNGAVPGDNIKGTILYVNRKRWFVGTRRGIQVAVEKNRTQHDVLDMVSFARKAFEAVLKVDGSNYDTESSGAIVYNIGL